MKLNRFGVGAIALAASGALVLSGCSTNGGDNAGSGDNSGKAIITANGSEPENGLVPTNTNETGGGRIINSLFTGLVSYDAKGAPQLDVAKSITTEDSQHFTVVLNDDREFSNGEKVTAKSFVDAWNWAAQVSSKQNNQSFFEDIEGFNAEADSELTGLKVVSDTEFTITLNQPVSDFELRLGYSAYVPLPEGAIKDAAAFGEHPIGNGPYKLAGDKAWTHKENIKLVKNEKYKGPREAKNDGLTIVFYSDPTAAYADLRSNNLDVLDQIPSSDLAKFQDDLGKRAINQPAAIFQSFTIPERLEHFSGEEGKLRRAAISQAINRPQITKTIFSETRTPAHDFTSPVIPGYSADVEGSDVVNFNADKAKELWAQADAIKPWSGTFQIAYNADGGHQSWVDAVTNQLKNVLGIDASGAPVPVFSAFRQEVTSGNIQTAFRTGWQGDYPGLYNFLAPLYATGASSNDGKYSNPEVDALLKDGLAATNIDDANKKFQAAQTILFTDLPAIPLWYSTVNGGFSDKVDNVVFSWNSQPIYEGITKK
ncbi:ABC transporter substrate-binding protein [Mycetocola tolaasinivorans]|uniref:ABC transporter substrate-binding protein n=1 Tax=Mycetocola tolaasinivorans TaxID=76635 RepID=A0A3L7A8I1_9MICO|nr:ABC transporter substrate-binding protein [Mycetocola tolaasinivorans]RLP76405.1 ABC transporter substrate-binding protein [Mycetocola tolaasinivorans]